MRIQDDILNTVAFVGVGSCSGIRLVGTMFFVTMKSVPGRLFLYGITAAHVIEGIRRESTDQLVHLRVTVREGGTVWVRTPLDLWRFHPTDDSVDTAAAPLTIEAPDGYLDIRAIPIDEASGIATSAVVAQDDIGVGDDVFLPGLFVNHTGTGRNIPIVRMGNIAAMPDEPVLTKRGPMEAYLVEARSIGGLSGSPVFVHLGPTRPSSSGGPTLRIRAGNTFRLLGVMHGHWSAPAPAGDSVVEDALRDEVVNMGIGIVTPISKVIELLAHPAFIGQRDKSKASGAAARATVARRDNPGA